MTAAEKLRLAQQLDRLGVDIIEAGFPISSDGDFEAVRTIAGAVRRPIIAGLARAIPADIDRAWAALSQARASAHPRVPRHLRHSSRAQAAHHAARSASSRSRSAVAHARAYCDDVEFSAEDATRSDLDFLCEVAEAAVNAGATTINLPDTVGYALPTDIERMFTTVGKRIGDRARAVGALPQRSRTGGRQFAGRHAGRRAPGRVHHQRHRRARRQRVARRDRDGAAKCAPMRCRIARASTPQALVPTSNALSAIVGVAVPPNKAIVGANAFAHEAGIHQDGMLKHELTYEIMRPESVGAPGTRLVLGKHSGMRGLDARCRALGHRLRQPRARTPVSQGHGARRSHQDGRRRAADRHHSRRAGRRRSPWARPAPAPADIRKCRSHVTEDRAAARRRHRPGSHRGSGPHSEERGRAFRQVVLVFDASDRRRRHRQRRHRPARAHARSGARRGCGAARRGRPSEVRRPAAVGASRSGAARAAPGARRICQPAPGDLLRVAREAHAVPARARARRQPADRPRAAGRPVFRRAARLRSVGQHRVQHADLLASRDRARRQGRVRARARAPQESRVDRQGQRARNVAAVARGRLGSRRRAIPTSSSSTSTSTPRRCGWRPRRPAST